jgi:glycosyltransferase involved in cell wall biosynthesis
MKAVYVGSYSKSDIMTGPEKVSRRVFEEYSKTEDTLFIHYFQDGRKYSYYKKLFGYEETDCVNGSKVLKLGIFRMLYKLFKLRPELIHVLCYNRFVVFLFLLKIFTRVKLYYTMNGIIRHENKYYNKESVFTVLKNIAVENVLIHCSDRIFYLSEFSKNILKIYYNPDNGKLIKAINGLDAYFVNQEFPALSERELNSVVFIGNIDQKEKGFDFLLQSLLICDMNIKLYIIDSVKKINQFKNYPNIEISVVDKMFPEQMVTFLKNKSIIVAPGEYDTFNISVLEAASCGLLPLLTNQTGVSEIICDYFPALLFDFNDKLSLKNAVQNRISESSHYCEYKDPGQLSWNNVVKNYYVSQYE